MPETAPRVWRGVVGRAELLCALQQQKDLTWFGLPSLTGEGGFERRVVVEEAKERATVTAFAPTVADEDTYRPPLQIPSFWVASQFDRESDSVDAQPVAKPPPAVAEPESLSGYKPDQARAAVDRVLAGSAKASWPRLRQQLRKRLCLQPSSAKRIDWSAVVRRLTQAQSALPLPLAASQRWPGSLAVVLDRCSPSLTPFVAEMDFFASRLRREVGRRGADVRVLSENYGAHYATWGHIARGFGKSWWPFAGGRVVLISDLARARSSEERSAFDAWRARLVHAGADLCTIALGAESASARALHVGTLAAHADQIDDLLSLIAFHGGVSDALLRALAEMVSPGPTPLRLIWSAWNHEAVERAGRHCALRATHAERYERRIPSMAVETLTAAARMAALFGAALPQTHRHWIALRWCALAPQLLAAADLATAHAAAQHFLSVDWPNRFENADAGERERMAAQIFQFLDLSHSRVRDQHAPALRGLQELAAARLHEAGAEVTVYPELGPVRIGGLEVPALPTVPWRLLRRGNELVLARADAPIRGILLGTVEVGAGVWIDSEDSSRWLRLDQTAHSLGELSPQHSLRMIAGSKVIEVAEIARPSRLEAWRQENGSIRIEVTAPWGEWLSLPFPSSPEQRYRIEGYEPFVFGFDGNLFAELTVGNATQRFRYILPGEFLMGSPNKEPERYDDEGPQHRVRITQGFWLADSACTQALWLAVMGSQNPSHFAADLNCPVEQVSFDDVQTFLKRLLPHLPEGCEAQLPSEAEWEYACRAGTTSPFSFGERISSAQVNFDGRFPYVGGQASEYRGKTVPVKSLPPNPWGLYEMHGNVWEWCRDAPRGYHALAPGQAELDPQGALTSGPSRAARGGSWIDLAQYARCAYRSQRERGSRSRILGFRFALRSRSPVGPEGRSSQVAPEAPWARRDAGPAVNDVAADDVALYRSATAHRVAHAFGVANLSPRYPPCFPPRWARAWGDDRYGLWAEFEVGGVVQRMRWIEPGEFLMGSPDDEPECLEIEGPQHRVRISAGFWLADTACTQALWLAVAGKNPSFFKDDLQCPVESVSAIDVQAYLAQLSQVLGDGALAQLPTEAQWEYACRAGTQTPFSFGLNITPAQANYDGNFPYAGGPTGLYRQRTLPVKSLPANPWGLFEMHGNVWEWCADAPRVYRALAPGQAELDPQGALTSGSSRAARGGSWFGDARGARCAYRYQFGRGHRNHALGFRFALRS